MRQRWPTLPVYKHPGDLLPEIAAPFGPYGSLLDIGGGPGVVGLHAWNVPIVHVLDIFEPHTLPPNFTLGTALDAARIYGRQNFDVVQCAEMVEHLPKSDGLSLLELLPTLARRLVLVTTPNGFVPQELDSGEEWAENPYQRHLSGYDPEHFTSRGYSIVLNEDGLGRSQIVAWKLCT